MTKEKISTFLGYALSQKEVSLVIANHENELTHFQGWLENKGYREAVGSITLLESFKHHKKLYMILNSEDGKDAYDIAIQYSTGQVELFNRETMENVLKNVDYKDRSVVFLVTEHQLAQLEKKNFSFLASAGMAFRNGDYHA